jgi:hypothetical protein
MTTLSELGNGTGLLHFTQDGAVDSFDNTAENLERVMLRLARFRTAHQLRKATGGASVLSAAYGVEVHVDTDPSAVRGTIAITALNVTQVLAMDDRNTFESVGIITGILTVTRRRPLTMITVQGEAGLDDTLTNIVPAENTNFIDGDLLVLVNIDGPAVDITLSVDGDSADGPVLVLRDAGAPIMRQGDVILFAYTENTNSWREVVRNLGTLKRRQKLTLVAGGASLEMTSTAEFTLLVVSGGGATLTGDNTISLPSNTRGIVDVVFNSPAYYGGGRLYIGGVLVPQALIESGRGVARAWYDNTEEEWVVVFLPVVQRTAMDSGSVSQGFRLLVSALGASAGAMLSANLVTARRSQPINPQAYALVEIHGTATINTQLTFENTYNLFTGLPDWMKPTDKSPAGGLAMVERDNFKGYAFTWIEVDSSGNLICRPINGQNLESGDIIYLDRFTYQSDDDT